MVSNVLLRELHQMRTFFETNCFCFLQSGLKGPAVAHDSPNQPEGAHPNRSSTMDERRPVLRIVGDAQEFGYLFFLGIGEDNGDVEILQAKFFGLRLFLTGAML